VKLTTHLPLVLRSRVRGAIPPLPQYAFTAWCLFKHRDNFTFYQQLQKQLLFLVQSLVAVTHVAFILNDSIKLPPPPDGQSFHIKTCGSVLTPGAKQINMSAFQR